MPIQFPPYWPGKPYAPDNSAQAVPVAFDVSNLALVGREFTKDSLGGDMGLDGNFRAGVNLWNPGEEHVDITTIQRPNPAPVPLPNDPLYALQASSDPKVNYALVGITRDSAGTILGSAQVNLFVAGSDILIRSTVSDASGNFGFGNPGTGPFYIRCYKVGSPDLAGTTVNTLMPGVLIVPAPDFVPAVLPQAGNKVFHLSADSLSLSDGTAVSSWVDSVNAVAATQGTGGLQPTFRTNLFGGKPGIRFDGSDDFLTLGRPTALATAVDSQINTTVVILRVLSGGLRFAFGASAGGDSYFFMGGGGALGRYDGSDTYSAPTAGNGFFVSAHTSIKPYSTGGGTGLQRSYLQGGCVGSFQVESPDSGGNNFTIGAITGSVLPANVEIFEIIVWDTALTPTEMLQVQKWACDKYSQPYPWTKISRFTVFDGDSLTAGVGAGGCPGTYPYKSAQSMGLDYGQWSNVGVGGMAMANMSAKSIEFRDIPAIIDKPMVVCAFEYYNERATAPATLQGYTNAYTTTIRGYLKTTLTLGTSVGHGGDPDANRVAHGAYYDANNLAIANGYVPLHTNASLGTQTAFATNGGGAGLNLWSGDGIHLNAAGYTVLAALMAAGLSATP